MHSAPQVYWKTNDDGGKYFPRRYLSNNLGPTAFNSGALRMDNDLERERNIVLDGVAVPEVGRVQSQHES
jgi:uncharacterized protein with beta-barrel porin domain